ncbi:MAG: aminoglycoside phosphotransferase family protein [Rhodospirillales bacterium]
MIKIEPALERALDAGRALTGAPVHNATQITGGGNNGVYRLEGADGPYALKLYRRETSDPRERLATEVAAHAFFKRQGVGPVAELIAADAKAGAALFTWIEGEKITAPVRADMDAAMDFIATLKNLSRQSDASNLPLASEACLSAGELVAQITRRHAKLSLVGDEELNLFLSDAFQPVFAALARAALPEADLAMQFRTLSPSDFGFHNALKAAGGGITFLDFEYFGWDDPAKLAADTIQHPGMNLAPILRHYAARKFHEIFAGDPDFTRRLSRSLPLYGLRWCMILLNVYLRDCGSIAANNEQKRAQLQKAQDMLARAQTLNEEDVHGA